MATKRKNRKDGELVMANKRKKRKASGGNANWTKAEVEFFYKAYRKYGKQWQKVADMVHSKSVEMVETLFKRNKTYLELPEGGATVKGLIAMMVDQGVIRRNAIDITETEEIEYSTRVRPLKNLGNTCYVNAVLQQLALLSVEDIGEHILCEPRCGGCYLHLILKEYRNKQAVSLDLLRSGLTCFGDDFEINRQADSAEFWDRAVTFLNVTHFLVETQHQVTCSLCNGTSDPLRTPSQSVLLDLHHGNLLSALREGSVAEVNYNCGHCGKSAQSHIRRRIVKFPQILAFHIGRWDASGGKVQDDFSFPSSVDMSKFGEGPAYYSLRGVIQHSGTSSNHGHYISFVKDDSSWHVADDEHVEPASLARVLDAEAFMLIYERSETYEPPEEEMYVQRRILVDESVVRRNTIAMRETEQIVCSTRLRPLKNLGNTCYVNAVLQQLALLSDEDIGEHILCEPHCGGCYLHLILKEYRNRQTVSLDLLRSGLTCFGDDFETNRQADSAEFWDRAVTFLNVTHFLVETQHQVTCSLCNGTSDPLTTPSQSVLLDLHHGNLLSALREGSVAEVNYNCGHCGKSAQSHIRRKIVKFPQILAFHIGRWDASGGKVQDDFSFPSSLDMSKFGEGPAYYSLRGVIQHSGTSSNHGHYISFVKDDSSWHVADDEHVEPASLARVLDAEAFMLIYERSESYEPPAEESTSVLRRIPVNERVIRAPPRPKRKSFKRKKSRKRSHVFRDIRRLQKSCDLLVPKKPFSNIVKEITQTNTRTDLKYQRTAMLALQEASESCLTSLFGDASLCSTHGKRKTLFPKDISLVKDIRGSPL